MLGEGHGLAEDTRGRGRGEGVLLLLPNRNTQRTCARMGTRHSHPCLTFAVFGWGWVGGGWVSRVRSAGQPGEGGGGGDDASEAEEWPPPPDFVWTLAIDEPGRYAVNMSLDGVCFLCGHEVLVRAGPPSRSPAGPQGEGGEGGGG